MCEEIRSKISVGIPLVEMMLRIKMKQIRSTLLSHGKGIEELITIPLVDRTIPGVDLKKVEEKEEDVTGPERKDSEVTLEAETGLGINLRAEDDSEEEELFPFRNRAGGET